MPNQESQYGAYVPTSQVFDPSFMKDLDINGSEFKDFITRLHQGINNISLVLNVKESGYYVPSEFLTGQLFPPVPAEVDPDKLNFQFRQSFRMYIDTGTLPNAGTKSVPHNVDFNSNFTLTKIWGAATDPTGNYIPLPYVSTSSLSNNITLEATSTNIIITTGSNRTNFTRSQVVIEYLKN